MASDIDPKIDPAFKAVVSEKKLLLGFLRDLFEYVKFSEPIDLTYKEDLLCETHEIESTDFYGTTGRIDLLVTLKDQSKIAVEMRIHDKIDVSERLQFYASQIFTNQYKAGQSYADDDILFTVVIDILASRLEGLQDDSMIHSFYYYDSLTKTALPQYKTNIITIELPKLDSYLATTGNPIGIAYWASFFRHSQEDQNLYKEYPLTVEAENLLEQKKADNNFAAAYKQAKDILDDEQSLVKT